MSDELITSSQWIHSCRVKDDERDFVCVKEKITTIDRDNNIVNSENKINIINNPKRKLWITKKQFQNHTDKKESEDIKKTDEYIIKDRDLMFELKRLSNMQYVKRYISLKDLCKSPYIYGADISMEALVRLHYLNQSKHRAFQLTTGAYDHEQSVLGCKRINAITVVLENEVYTAVLEDFTHNNIDEHGNKFTSNKERLLNFAHEALQPYIQEYKFNLNLEVFDNEVDMVKYIFKKIHLHKVDFIGIWNIDYDVPSLIERMNEHGVSLEDIAHHPDLPNKYKFLNYKQDKRPTQHNVDKWHWLHNVSHSQFFDAMLTYARIRKTQTKEPSYSLDAISSKVIGKGKLKFEGQLDHHEMQSKHFMKYVAYNIADAILIQLMFKKTHDPEALVELTGVSPLRDFSKQTTLLKDQLYAYYLSLGRVLGSSCNGTEELHAKILGKIGGTVLSPYLIKNSGLHALTRHPELETYAHAHNFDADFASIYPYTKISFSISKDTKLSTLVNIDGKRNTAQIERLCGGIATPMENSVPLCTDFFGLPSYIEMKKLFDEYLNTKLRGQ